MSNDRCLALWREGLAAGWVRWSEGMIVTSVVPTPREAGDTIHVALYVNGVLCKVTTDDDGYGWRSEIGDSYYEYPDFAAPATVGCLWAQLREACVASPSAGPFLGGSSKSAEAVVYLDGFNEWPCKSFCCATEAEAILLALRWLHEHRTKEAT